MRESAANAQSHSKYRRTSSKRKTDEKCSNVSSILFAMYTIYSLTNVMVFVFRLFLLIFKFKKIPHRIHDFGPTMTISYYVRLKSINSNVRIKMRNPKFEWPKINLKYCHPSTKCIWNINYSKIEEAINGCDDSESGVN